MNEILSLELKAEQERLGRLIQKRAAIQKGYDLPADEGQKFKYAEELRDLDKEIAPLKQKLKEAGIDFLPRSAPWWPLLEQHGVSDDMRLSDTVNCNREKHYGEGLLAHFKQEMRGNNNLFYCIVACPYQRPVSIAKRLVYEIEGKKMPIARIADAANPDEVAVSAVEFGFDPEHTWQLLWDTVRKRMGAPGQPTETPGDLAAQYADKHRIALVYRLHVQAWEQETLEHLRYVVGKFQDMDEEHRKYLLFLAVEFPHVHAQNCEKYAQELAQLANICTEANTNGLRTACVSLLPPVAATSIENWSSNVLLRDKKTAFEAILQNLQKSTPSDHFDMELVENLQEAAWEYRNRPRPDLPF